MKKKFLNIKIVATLTVCLIAISCSDFMDLEPKDQYSDSDVWSDAGLTQSVVNDIYAYLIHGSEEINTSALTDDAYFTHNFGAKAVNETAISGSDLQYYGRTDCPITWQQRYLAIYRANLVLANIDNVPESPMYNVKTIKGEAYFLRAFLYMDLLRGFGGVPLVDRVYNIEEATKIDMPRSNVADCLDFILKDLDQAIALLPETVKDADLGRATSGAAKAIKARMLLHVASPLYADRKINTLECNQYNGDRKALYEQALTVAKEIMNSGTYQLIDCNAGTTQEIATKFHSIATTNNKELIFTKQFSAKGISHVIISNRASICHGPNGYHNWAGVTPTQDLVMAFEMEDGSLWEANTTPLTIAGQSTTKSPYINREPRFYASIGYDGAEWGRERPADSKVFDPTPLGNLQMGYYEINGGEKLNITLPNGQALSFTGQSGVDTRKSPIEDWNGSFTGYVEKKLIDGSVPATGTIFQLCPFPYIRLAEIYLIAAEACIELNKLDEAITYLDALRGRIGRPDTKTTLAIRNKSINQTDLRDFLYQERRVELTYEESRYYDIRRWMIADKTNNKPLTGIMVIGRLKTGQTATLPYIRDENKWDYTYYVTDLAYIESRKWADKMYFVPIHVDEIARNPAMNQNPGY
ncbi:MAG: RagB/SusD family nutrient uptake outer membrane protein [Prevotella sp.]|jgi:hypothetical protein|nr:RagB/SusD family nutrient uptake outer membrane protein [Prevotella sp.]